MRRIPNIDGDIRSPAGADRVGESGIAAEAIGWVGIGDPDEPVVGVEEAGDEIPADEAEAAEDDAGGTVLAAAAAAATAAACRRRHGGRRGRRSRGRDRILRGSRVFYKCLVAFGAENGNFI